MVESKSLPKGKGLLPQILRSMKLTVILIFGFLMQVSATGTAQTVTLSENNTTLDKVFKEIRKQTGYDFLYSYEVIQNAGKVSVRVKNAALRTVLNEILQSKKLGFKIFEKTVVIKPEWAETSAGVEQMITATDISGKIVNENGEPVPGVTVAVKGTKNAIAANAEGEFLLKNVDENATLIITGVNIEKREIQVAGRTNLGTIIVKNKIAQGQEITVEIQTGYQTLPRERATGAYDIINRDKIEERIFTNVTEALEGQAPGLSTYKGNVVVRGRSTFSSEVGLEPLIVIDGMPTERSMDDVNMNDVESLTILKDAAASAIYGVRAANGVIVITTKGGRFTNESRTSIQFTSDLRWTDNPKLSDFHYASSKDYIDYELAMIERDAAKRKRTELEQLDISLKGIGQAGTTSNSINYYSPVRNARLDFLRGDINKSEYGALISKWSQTDYRQEYMDRFWQSPLRQSYNLSLNSSASNQSTYASLNYINDGQQNRFNKSEYVRGYIKSLQKLNKWFSFEIGSDIQYNHRVNVQNVYADISSIEPYTSILDEDGNKVYRDYADIAGMQGILHVNPRVLSAIQGLPQFESFKYNVLDELQDNLITQKNYSVRSFVRMNLNITRDLKFSTGGEYEFTKNKSEDFRSRDSYFMRFKRNSFANYDPANNLIPAGGRMSTVETSANSWVWRNQLDFNKRIGSDHQIHATGGLELRQIHAAIPTSSLYYGYDPIALTYTSLDNYTIDNTGYKQSYIYNNNTGLPGSVIDGSYIKLSDGAISPSLSEVTNRYVGLYGVAGYTYKGKYVATGSVRVDQTNLFGTDPKYRYRPLWSAGVKWNASKEDFLRSVSWIDMLDVRFSYGLTGNVDQTTTPFLVASLGTQSSYSVASYQYTNITSAPNPMLRWEKTSSYNAGVDYSLFSGILNGKLDVYYKKSSDLLGTKEVHFTSGYATQRVNSGIMTNKGFELTISSPWYKQNNLVLASTVIFSYNKNTVTKAYFHPTQASHLAISHYLVEGQPFDGVYAYQYGGLTSGGTDYQNGVPIIYRADGTTMHHFQDDGTLLLDGSSSMGVNDVVYMGSLTPTVSASFTQNVRYKGFELSALFLYYGGNVMYKPSFGFNITDGNEDWIGKAWRPDNTSSTIPKSQIYYEPGISVVNLGSLEGMYIRSTENVVSGAFLRLRNVALSYTLPNEISQYLKLVKLRLTAQVNNPWIWSAAGKQYDSEVQSSVSNSVNLRNWGLPMPTTYLLRLDVIF